MQDETQMRDVIAMLTDMNLKNTGVASVPEVGLYWMSRNGSSFYIRSVSLSDAVTYDQFKTYDGSHWDEWAGAQKKYPAWKDKEYDQIPRGRVVFKMGSTRKENEFVIYLPVQLAGFKDQIREAFKIPPEYARFDFSDEHYRL